MPCTAPVFKSPASDCRSVVPLWRNWWAPVKNILTFGRPLGKMASLINMPDCLKRLLQKASSVKAGAININNRREQIWKVEMCRKWGKALITLQLQFQSSRRMRVTTEQEQDAQKSIHHLMENSDVIFLGDHNRRWNLVSEINPKIEKSRNNKAHYPGNNFQKKQLQ